MPRLLVLAVLLAACGGSTSHDAGPDSGGDDAGCAAVNPCLATGDQPFYCGMTTVKDACGDTVTVDCGTCGTDFVCVPALPDAGVTPDGGGTSGVCCIYDLIESSAAACTSDAGTERCGVVAQPLACGETVTPVTGYEIVDCGTCPP